MNVHAKISIAAAFVALSPRLGHCDLTLAEVGTLWGRDSPGTGQVLSDGISWSIAP